MRWMTGGGGGDAAAETTETAEAAEAGDDESKPPSKVRECKTLIRFDEFERLPAA